MPTQEIPLWLSWLRTRQSVREDVGLISGRAAHCSMGRTCGSGIAVAVAQALAAAPIVPLAQELPHATGAILRRREKKNSCLPIVMMGVSFIFVAHENKMTNSFSQAIELSSQPFSTVFLKWQVRQS